MNFRKCWKRIITNPKRLQFLLMLMVVLVDVVATIMTAVSYLFVVDAFDDLNFCAEAGDYKLFQTGCAGDRFSNHRTASAICYYVVMLYSIINVAYGAGEVTKDGNLQNETIGFSHLRNDIVYISYVARNIALFSYLNFVSDYDDSFKVIFRTAEATITFQWLMLLTSVGLVLFTLAILSHNSSVSVGSICSCERGVREWAYDWIHIGIIMVTMVCITYSTIFYIAMVNTMDLNITAFIEPRGPRLLGLSYLNYGLIVCTFLEFFIWMNIRKDPAAVPFIAKKLKQLSPRRFSNRHGDTDISKNGSQFSSSAPKEDNEEKNEAD